MYIYVIVVVIHSMLCVGCCCCHVCSLEGCTIAHLHVSPPFWCIPTVHLRHLLDIVGMGQKLCLFVTYLQLFYSAADVRAVRGGR